MDTKKFLKVVRENNPFLLERMTIENPREALIALEGSSNSLKNVWIEQIGSEGITFADSVAISLASASLMAVCMAFIENFGADATRDYAAKDFIDIFNKYKDAGDDID